MIIQIIYLCFCNIFISVNTDLRKPFQVLEDAGFKDGQKHCVKKNRCEELEDTFNTASNSYRDNERNSWLYDYVFYKKIDNDNVRMTQGTTSIIENLSVHEGILLTIDVRTKINIVIHDI